MTNMEDDNKRILQRECPRKLNLNVPHLSIRCPLNVAPFWWEGVPPEPVHWEVDSCNSRNVDQDDGCDGDVDDDEDDYQHSNKGRKGCSSDAIDIFSLAESVYGVEETCEISEDPLVYDDSPNFIIQRFLPDAQALAAAAVAKRKVPFSPASNSTSSFPQAVSATSAHPSMRGCGIGNLLPWRIMNKLRSLKSSAPNNSARLVNLQKGISRENNI